MGRGNTVVKICTRCKKEKNVEEFHKLSRSKDGLQYNCKECTSAIMANYWKNNKAARTKYGRAYYAAHKDETRQYRINNRDKINAYQLAYIKARSVSDPLFVFTRKIRKLMCNQITNSGYTKRSKTAKIVGCTFEKLMEWLGPRPDGDFQIDHIVPCAQAQSEDEFLMLQHHTNLQWLSREENLEKSDNATPDGLLLCEVLLGRPWIYKQGEK